tara:strand:+ start:25 stop:843 length:819 start_codon:yes stop_codon:yes gene_type:complete
MRNLLKLVAASLTAFILLPSHSFAINNVNAAAISICEPTGTMLASGGNCRSTPTQYGITIYEMGLCTSHPFGAAKTAAAFDSSVCVQTYSNPSATEVDLAANIGGVSPLPGTSTAPAVGSYSFPYIIMGQNFTVSGEFRTFKSDGSGGVNGGSVTAQTDALVQFGNSANTCFSGYVGAVVTGGTIDGFVTDTSFGRSATATNGECDKRGRLVGVMNLSTPVVVTPKTYSVVFNFLLTNNGIQWSDTDNDGSDGPEEFGSAPFAGYFVIKDAD